jgi:hypothetical protein
VTPVWTIAQLPALPSPPVGCSQMDWIAVLLIDAAALGPFPQIVPAHYGEFAANPPGERVQKLPAAVGEAVYKKVLLRGGVPEDVAAADQGERAQQVAVAVGPASWKASPLQHGVPEVLASRTKIPGVERAFPAKRALIPY